MGKVGYLPIVEEFESESRDNDLPERPFLPPA